MISIFRLLAPMIIAALPAISNAGSSSGGKSVIPTDAIYSFANQVHQDLAARGVSVAIVARVGRNPAQLPDAIRYTHLGFFVYSKITQPDGTIGQGYRVYNLYQRSNMPTISDLVQDSPAEFFSGVHQLDAGIVIPAATLQRKLLSVINSPTYAGLHNPRYAVLANPHNNQFQNSNEHVLNVLIAAIYGTHDLPQIKANIAAYFNPQVVQISHAKRALAAIAAPALNTNDHGQVIGTTTFGSVSRFFQKYGLAQDIYRITPAGASGF